MYSEPWNIYFVGLFCCVLLNIHVIFLKCLQLPRICLALTDLTDDHHNMCLLVQLLPYNTRGK